MLNVSRQNNQPLWDVILQSDLLESGLTRPQSLAEMHHLWPVSYTHLTLPTNSLV